MAEKAHCSGIFSFLSHQPFASHLMLQGATGPSPAPLLPTREQVSFLSGFGARAIIIIAAPSGLIVVRVCRDPGKALASFDAARRGWRSPRCGGRTARPRRRPSSPARSPICRGKVQTASLPSTRRAPAWPSSCGGRDRLHDHGSRHRDRACRAGGRAPRPPPRRRHPL